MTLENAIAAWQENLDEIRASAEEHMRQNTWDTVAIRAEQGRLVCRFITQLNAIRDTQQKDKGPG